jgi:NTE family protein
LLIPSRHGFRIELLSAFQNNYPLTFYHSWKGYFLTKAKDKIPFESVTMLLQGGGALGAYQAGVYQALSEAGLEPDWVTGISIGAINAAIIAGNPLEDRLAKLRAFWEAVTLDDFRFVPPVFKALLTRSDSEFQMLNLASAVRTLFFGIPEFFKPRMISPWLAGKGTMEATSFCDTAPLKATLEQLVDFDRLNGDDIRFTIGAVNVTTGNFTSFDNETQRITPEHVMASGALPPGFPPIQIGEDYYWDGGLISNTPLQWLLERRLTEDALIFQVDLWSADGEFPQNMAEVFTRMKDIQYSSRTRANTDRFKENHGLCHALGHLLSKLPEDLKKLPEVKLLEGHGDCHVYNIVHLIYHNKGYEGYSKDFEFSRLSMEAHWLAGYEDTNRSLAHPEVLQRPHNKEGVGIFDFSKREPIAPSKKKAKAA